MQDVYDRAGIFHKRLVEKHPGDNVLIISHQVFSLCLILNSLNLDITEDNFFNIDNASISTLDMENGEVRDYHINDSNHLIAEAVREK